MRAHYGRLGVLGIALCRAALASDGGQLVSADFESPLVIGGSPALSIDDDYSDAGLVIGIDPAAAHRGDGGLRVTSTQPHPPTGLCGQASIGWTFDTPASSAAYYVRFWVRMQAATPPADLTLTEVLFPPNIGTLSYQPMAGINTGACGLVLGGDDVGCSSNYCSVAMDGGLDPGWHLLEMGVTGVGAPNGTRVAWVDGQLSGLDRGVDWTGAQEAVVNVGDTWSCDGAFIGTLDVDDLRSSFSPPASTLAASVAPCGGLCAALTVTMLDSSGVPAAAPYDVQVVVKMPAGVATFADPECSTPSAVVVSSGAPSAVVWLGAPAPIAGTLAIGHIDFIGASSVPFELTPRPPEANLGCGCDGGASPEGWGAAVALAACALRRRRKRQFTLT